MSDAADKSSRTEPPTAKRLQEAFDEGNFPRAQEIGVTFILIGAFMYLSFQGPALAVQVAQFSTFILGHLHQFDFTPTSIADLLPKLFISGLIMVLPFLLVCCVAAYLAGGLQTGFKTSNNKLKIDFGRINLVGGFSTLFGTQKLVEFAIGLVKFIVVGWILWGVIGEIKKDPIFYTTVSIQHIVEFIYKSFLAMLWQLILTIGVIAALNYAYSKWQFMENHKMTKQEVEDEMKNSEGNPEIKGKRRSMAYRNAYRQFLTKVPLADVVVTNPTHFAIALKYERGKDSAPVVIAKGQDLFAQRIKQIAAANDVPMVENKPVARALYKMAVVGKAIPADLYNAVAQILAFVYRTHRYYFHRLKARRLEANV
jgi:flagellar biosynthetic protein FlhB